MLSAPNATNEVHSITVTCTIHPDSTADQCVVMAMDDGRVISTGNHIDVEYLINNSYCEHVHMHKIANKEFKFVCSYVVRHYPQKLRILCGRTNSAIFPQNYRREYIKALKLCHGYVSYTENKALMVEVSGWCMALPYVTSFS